MAESFQVELAYLENLDITRRDSHFYMRINEQLPINHKHKIIIYISINNCLRVSPSFLVQIHVYNYRLHDARLQTYFLICH